jgi:hypothetical protein
MAPAILITLPCLRVWGVHHGFNYKQIYTEASFIWTGWRRAVSWPC